MAAFTLMIPILAGYIAYAIGDRPALAPGFIGGWIANNGSFYGADAGTGFIGAIIAGLLVGYLVRWIATRQYHKMVQPLVPILIAPIVGSLFIAAVFIFIIGAPIADMMTGLNAMLLSMSGGSLVLLGIVLGGMAGFDMGGPGQQGGLPVLRRHDCLRSDPVYGRHGLRHPGCAPWHVAGNRARSQARHLRCL